MAPKMVRCAAAAVASVACAAAFPQITLTGKVVEGNDAQRGIYNVSVDVLVDGKRTAHARTEEDGSFAVTVSQVPPFDGVVFFRKPTYKENPTKLSFSVASATTRPYKLSSVQLIPEDASNDYLQQVLNRVAASWSKSGGVDAFAAYAPLLSLPPARKAFVFEQARNKDPDLFTSLRKAEADQADARKLEDALRKSDPSAVVTPNFAGSGKDRFIITGKPAKALANKNWDKALPMAPPGKSGGG